VISPPEGHRHFACPSCGRIYTERCREGDDAPVCLHGDAPLLWDLPRGAAKNLPHARTVPAEARIAADPTFAPARPAELAALDVARAQARSGLLVWVHRHAMPFAPDYALDFAFSDARYVGMTYQTSDESCNGYDREGYLVCQEPTREKAEQTLIEHDRSQR
jgi:hypothetical protein